MGWYSDDNANAYGLGGYRRYALGKVESIETTPPLGGGGSPRAHCPHARDQIR